MYGEIRILKIFSLKHRKLDNNTVPGCCVSCEPYTRWLDFYETSTENYIIMHVFATRLGGS